jgi:D-alanyl-D-alanine carboxypeptidase
MIRRFAPQLLLALAACGGASRTTSPNDQLAADLARLLDTTLAQSPEVPGVMLRVEAPTLGFVWTNAVGVFDKATREPLRPEHTVRIASNTKTYVAAAILRLVEDGKLGLDDPIGRHVLPASVAKLKEDGYDAGAITVRMLLQHTSGLFDYAMSPEFLGRAGSDPTHRWTRAEQVAFAVDHGAPYGAPGAVYHYSDTGYILLGEILEKVTGRSMAQAVRDLVDFDRHGIRFTYFETLDSVPPGTPPQARQYFDSLDATGFDASVDLYGGGGLVSNLEDLAKFYRALVRGEVFKQKATLDTMLVMSPQSQQGGGGGYGMGIGRGETGGVVCYGHGGFWGTVARHCPAIDLTVTAAVNQTSGEALPKVTIEAMRLAAAAIAARR